MFGGIKSPTNFGNRTDDRGEYTNQDPGSLRVSQEFSPPINEVVGSVASSRFKGRPDKKRERYNKFGMYAAVTSTLEKSGGMTKISIGKQKVD